MGYFSLDDIYGVISIGTELDYYAQGRMGNWNEQIRPNGPTVLQLNLDFLQDEDFRRPGNKKKRKKTKNGRKIPRPSENCRTGIKKVLVAIVRTLSCHFGDWILIEDFIVSIVVSWRRRVLPRFRYAYRYKHNMEKIV